MTEIWTPSYPSPVPAHATIGCSSHSIISILIIHLREGKFDSHSVLKKGNRIVSVGERLVNASLLQPQDSNSNVNAR
jgi:hypothetical protein